MKKQNPIWFNLKLQILHATDGKKDHVIDSYFLENQINGTFDFLQSKESYFDKLTEEDVYFMIYYSICTGVCGVYYINGNKKEGECYPTAEEIFVKYNIVSKINKNSYRLRNGYVRKYIIPIGKYIYDKYLKEKYELDSFMVPSIFIYNEIRNVLIDCKSSDEINSISYCFIYTNDIEDYNKIEYPSIESITIGSGDDIKCSSNVDLEIKSEFGLKWFKNAYYKYPNIIENIKFVDGFVHEEEEKPPKEEETVAHSHIDKETLDKMAEVVIEKKQSLIRKIWNRIVGKNK